MPSAGPLWLFVYYPCHTLRSLKEGSKWQGQSHLWTHNEGIMVYSSQLKHTAYGVHTECIWSTSVWLWYVQQYTNCCWHVNILRPTLFYLYCCCLYPKAQEKTLSKVIDSTRVSSLSQVSGETKQSSYLESPVGIECSLTAHLPCWAVSAHHSMHYPVMGFCLSFISCFCILNINLFNFS